MTVGRLRHLVRGRPAPEAYGVAAGTHCLSPAIAAVFAKDCSLAAVGPAARSTGVRGGVGRSRYPGVDSCRPVGAVGTRNATQAGRATAARFGCELAEAGVVVLSGLARDTDAAAQRGSLSCPRAISAAVVACGLCRLYPKQNIDLGDAVAAWGVLISEWPVGTSPDPFRFPLRNRILAALVEVLVVVESRHRGGSLITVREAADRSVDVMAVPGSAHSRASDGTNKLLADGAIAARRLLTS